MPNVNLKRTVLVLCAVCVWSLPGGGFAAGAAPTQLECGSIASKILGRAVNYCVDLPADYASSGQRYPSLYFLHGMFENYHAWDQNGGKDVLDSLLSAGKIGAFIVVLPDADNTFYVNSYNGKDRYEDFFIQELIPAIDRKYRTFPDAQHRGVSGVSMGGYGALHLAMRHPDLFGSVSAQGAALVQFPHPIPTTGRWGFYARILEHSFGNPLNETYWDANNPLTLAADPSKFAGLKIYFDCGTHDRYGFEKGAEQLDQTLNAHDYPHVFALRPGDHGWDYLQKYMKYALIFHWRAFSGQQAMAAGRGRSR
ncbi:MAG: alpha/beta hydrolase [Terriglobia bacterium]